MEPTHAKKAYWLIVLIIILAVAAAALLWQMSRYEEVLTSNPEVQGAATTTDATWKTYANPTFGYEIKYPAAFTQIGTDQEVVFTIPSAYTEGTNLSSNSQISVKVLRELATCSPKAFFAEGHEGATEVLVQKGNVLFRVSSTTEAATGNMYEDTVYTTGTTEQCVGISLFLHSTQIANYEPGTRVEFKRSELMSIFDQMVASFTFAK